MTNWPPVRRSACSRSWTRSAGSRPSSIQGSAIGPKTWLRPLNGACAATGYPKTIRVDQGSEFVSRDLDLWAYAKGVTLDFSRPGKPTDNAFIEAFNGRFRAECLNTHWFLTLADAREKLEDWRKLLQRRSAAWRHRQQAPGFPHDSRRRIQPASVAKARKTLPSGGPTMGSRSKPAEALIACWMKVQWQVSSFRTVLARPFFREVVGVPVQSSPVRVSNCTRPFSRRAAMQSRRALFPGPVAGPMVASRRAERVAEGRTAGEGAPSATARI